MTSTTFRDLARERVDADRARYAGYDVEHLVGLMITRDETIAAWRDAHVDLERSLTYERSEHEDALRRAEEHGRSLGRAAEVERVTSLTLSYDRGCDDGKRDYLINQLGYDVPVEPVEWSVTVTATWTAYVMGDPDEGPDSDAFDVDSAARYVENAVGLYRGAVSVDWSTD